MSTNPSPPLYAPEITLPMEQELTSMGFTALRTKEDVASSVDTSGTVLAVVNSVCGCAAGAARPGVALAIEQAKKKPLSARHSLCRCRSRRRRSRQSTYGPLSFLFAIYSTV